MLGSAGVLPNYEPGGSRPPKRKRIAKKCLVEWAKHGWKCGKWFSEAFETAGSWFGKWLPVGPYNAHGNINYPRRHKGESQKAYSTRATKIMETREKRRGLCT